MSTDSAGQRIQQEFLQTTSSETWENMKTHSWNWGDQSQTGIAIKLWGENITRIFKRNSEVIVKLFLMGYKNSAQQGQGHMLGYVKEEWWIFFSRCSAMSFVQNKHLTV